jgi:N-methylhydantoinase B/oxoprolinase/acetone carboxylase alpha subunit
MESRIAALKDRYESGMGMPKDFAFLSPHSREIFQKLGRDVDKIDPIGEGGKSAGGVTKKVVERRTTASGKKLVKYEDGTIGEE